jgi:hypothetical protein
MSACPATGETIPLGRPARRSRLARKEREVLLCQDVVEAFFLANLERIERTVLDCEHFEPLRRPIGSSRIGRNCLLSASVETR